MLDEFTYTSQTPIRFVTPPTCDLIEILHASQHDITHGPTMFVWGGQIPTILLKDSTSYWELSMNPSLSMHGFNAN